MSLSSDFVYFLLERPPRGSKERERERAAEPGRNWVLILYPEPIQAAGCSGLLEGVQVLLCAAPANNFVFHLNLYCASSTPLREFGLFRFNTARA